MSARTWWVILIVTALLLLWVAAEMFVPIEWFIDYRDPADTFWGNVLILFSVGLVSFVVFAISILQLAALRRHRP